MTSSTDIAVDVDRLRITPDRRVPRADAGRKIFRRSSKTLCEWGAKGWGPKPILVGGRVFYDVDECFAMARGEKPIKPVVAA